MPDEVMGPGFLDTYGDVYNQLSWTTTWAQSTLNRGQLATRGHAQSVALEVAIPGSDLTFYKLSYNGQLFVPLNETFTLRFRTELGYGDGYGDLDRLPFYTSYYAGGYNSVRGFKSSSLGPRSTPAWIYQTAGYDGVNSGYVRLNDKNRYEVYRADDIDDGDPIGGNILITGSAELLFPLPFIKDQRSVRSSLFIDSGQVYSTNCGATQVNCYNVDLSKLVYSAGIGLTWITGMGPLTFSIAKALRDSDYDRTEFFQFSIGAGF